jgi:hypothetical protein
MLRRIRLMSESAHNIAATTKEQSGIALPQTPRDKGDAVSIFSGAMKTAGCNAELVERTIWASCCAEMDSLRVSRPD